MTRTIFLMAYIMVIWFVISFVTNLIGPLMPVVISDFHLSLGLAGFLPFSFFLAYGLISIPAGALVEARGPRATLLGAFALNLSGCLAISLSPTYLVVIAGLFVIGVGMAMLQVVINPLMRTTGGEEHFAFFSVMAQLVFGAASFVSPLVFATLMKQPPTPERPIVWVKLYWAFVAVYVVLLLITSRLTIRQLTLADDERPGTAAMYRSLLRERPVRLFFLGIIAYVGTEQSLADWMSQFLATFEGGARGRGRVGDRLRRTGPVRPGGRLAHGVPRGGLLPVRYVVDRLLAGPQFREPLPRRFLRDPVHRNPRRRDRAALRRDARRPPGTTARDAQRVRDARLHPERRLLGATAHPQRDGRLSPAIHSTQARQSRRR